MKKSRARFWGAVALVLTLVSAGQWIFFRHSLARANRPLVEAGFQGVQRVLDYAQRVHDDLILQEAVLGLSQGPGVRFAYLTDASDKILAHTDPSRIGLRIDKKAPAVWRWGKLRLDIADSTRRTALQRQACILFVFNAGLIGCLMFLFKRWDYATRASAATLAELDFRFQHVSRQLDQERSGRDAAQLRWTLWTQGALELAPVAVLLLDASQRVAACNRAARQALGFSENLSGRSWQDLPLLAECGEALQQSLEQPGQEIETIREHQKILFFSDASSLAAGTWVCFHSTSLS